MHKLRIIAAVAVLAFANQVQAAPPSMYASLEWLEADFESVTDSGWAVSLGYELTRFAAIEARGGLTTGNEPVEIDHFVSGFLRLSLPDWPAARIHPYLLAGYTDIKVSSEAAGFSWSHSEDDVSYGIGIHFFGSENASLKLEAVQYIDKGELDISAYSVGFAYRF